MKLLIAEDELATREGLMQCIPDFFTQVRAASNGQAAYELALEMEPDVLLCDIRMPKMNGIHLAQKLRERFPSLHILFISGYADKEYLKAAIALQVDGYIEKPIDEAELTSFLTRVAEQVRARRKDESDHEQMAEHAGLFARQQLLYALLREPGQLDAALRQSGTVGEALKHADGCLAAVVTLCWADTMSAQQIDAAGRRVCEAIEARLPDSTLCGALTNEQIGVVVWGELSAASLIRVLEPTLAELLKGNSEIVGACACVGGPSGNLRELSELYQRCRYQAQWMAFSTGPGSSVRALMPHAAPPEDRSQALNRCLQALDFEGAKALVMSQTQEIARRSAGSIDDTRKYYELLLSVCLNANHVDQPVPANTIQRLGILSAFARLRTLPELSRFILAHIDDLMPSIDLPQTSVAKIQEALDVVRRNLADPSLSVQSIAASLGVTENYLSALFKRETGHTLHSVIIDLRMERAKYLLLKRQRLPEVAEKTGFSSASYFHSVFKKHTGLSPAEFVRQAAAGEDKP